MTCTKPDWLKIRLPKSSAKHEKIRSILRGQKLFTVCEEAHCPNQAQCWAGGKNGGSTATFLIMGDVCTRACRFCNTKSGYPNGVLDKDEPKKLAKTISKLNLDYVVITSVDRDDLEDGGAAHFAKVIREVKTSHPKILIEVLIPDFAGDKKALEKIIAAKPTVIAHNLETTRALQKLVRDGRANFDQSLSVLKHIKEKNKEKEPSAPYAKTALMLGFGEKDDDVISAMTEAREAGVDIFTLGQYLQPSEKQIEVKEYVKPKKFAYFKEVGEKLGFMYVASGPFVRSSYRAGELFLKNLVK